MSFDLFVQCFGETERSGLSTSDVRALFPIYEEEPRSNSWLIRAWHSLFPLKGKAVTRDFWRVEYGPEDGCEFYVGLLERDKKRLNDFMVARPCGDPRFWESLYSILRMGSVVIYWPGSPLVFAAGASLEGLPEGILEGLGGPVYVESGMEILKRVQET